MSQECSSKKLSKLRPADVEVAVAYLSIYLSTLVPRYRGIQVPMCRYGYLGIYLGTRPTLGRYRYPSTSAPTRYLIASHRRVTLFGSYSQLEYRLDRPTSSIWKPSECYIIQTNSTQCGISSCLPLKLQRTRPIKPEWIHHSDHKRPVVPPNDA